MFGLCNKLFITNKLLGKWFWYCNWLQHALSAQVPNAGLFTTNPISATITIAILNLFYEEIIQVPISRRCSCWVVGCNLNVLHLTCNFNRLWRRNSLPRTSSSRYSNPSDCYLFIIGSSTWQSNSTSCTIELRSNRPAICWALYRLFHSKGFSFLLALSSLLLSLFVTF